MFWVAVWVAGCLSVLLGALLAVLLFYLRKGIPLKNLERVNWAIGCLLRQGLHGGILTLSFARSQKFLQFLKYIHAPGEYGIELVFPRTDWSEEYYWRLRALCESEGLEYRVSILPADEELVTYLFVDFAKDVDAAYGFARRVFAEVLDVPVDAQVFSEIRNAVPEDRLVDSRSC